MAAIEDMNERAQEIFRLIVEEVMQTGNPAGSRSIADHTATKLSPASVRNVMADLEDLGLIYAPHTSAGRIPTPMGVRLFVESFMEVKIPDAARKRIEGLESEKHNSLETMIASAGKLVSELSACTAIVAAPKLDRAVREIRFIPLHGRQAVTIIVYENGSVENRVLTLPDDIAPSSLIAATNFLNTRLSGKTIAEATKTIRDEIKQNRAQLDALSAALIEQGVLSHADKNGPFYVHGYGNLIDTAAEDIKGLQTLFQNLDRQETVAKVLKAAEDGEGIGIFIGQESDLVKNTGLSLVTAPARDKDHKIVGAVGVIGPANANFARIVPVVDLTAKVMARLIG